MALPPESIEELLEEADLKRRRLARKAELARASRKQKKEAIEDLQREVAELQQELEHERQRTRHAQHEAALAQHQLAQLRAAGPANPALDSTAVGMEVEVVVSEPAAAVAVEAEILAPAIYVPGTVTAPVIAVPMPVPALAPMRVPFSISAIVTTTVDPAPVVTATEVSVATAVDPLAAAIKVVLSAPATDESAAATAIASMMATSEAQGAADAASVAVVARHGEQCLPASFLRWFLSHGDAFYEDPNGLWQMVMGNGVVAATVPQTQGVLGLRTQAAEARVASTELQCALADVRAKLTKANTASAATLQKLVAQLSSPQLLAFFRFVDVHGSVCIKINNL
jgi:hypothetical protein